MQAWLDSIGLTQVDLATQALAVLDNLDKIAGQLIVPLQSIAVASVGAVGTMLIVFILSIYMVIDRDQIMAFLFRLVPPTYAEEARLLQTAIARSFGGLPARPGRDGHRLFRGRPGRPPRCSGCGSTALSAVAAGVLMAIPFFGPFIAWAPPVIVALFTKPEAFLPTLVIMGVGWFVVMNVLQPRIMQGAVGIHPIVVLGSVLDRLARSRASPGRSSASRSPRSCRRSSSTSCIARPATGRVAGPRRQAAQRARGPAGPRPA